MYDLNQDGKLSAEEAKEYVKMWAEKRMVEKKDADVVATFDEIDINKDGYIDKNELYIFIKDQRTLHSELFINDAEQQAMEALEQEIKDVEFEFEIAPDNETKITKGIAYITSLFIEFQHRIEQLKTNPRIQSFIAMLCGMEKTVKDAMELLEQW